MNERTSPSRRIPTRPLAAIGAAADLLLDCLGYIEDTDNISVGGPETYYAVDTDVLVMYLRPDQNTKYLACLGNDRHSPTALQLTFMAGDFLFSPESIHEPVLLGGRTHPYRFLIIPPHDEEILAQITGYHDELMKVGTVTESTLEELGTILDAFIRSGDQEALVVSLRREVPSLLELYNPFVGPKAALLRFAKLDFSSFRRLDDYREDRFSFPMLTRTTNVEDAQVDEALYSKWLAWLKAAKVASMRQGQLDTNEGALHYHNIQRDARVLAALEYANIVLRRGSKQLVLITGTPYLFKAAGGYFPIEGDDRSFADLYLRQPKALMAHQEFFRLPGRDFTLVSWLRLLLPSELGSAERPLGRVDREQLRRTAHRRAPVDRDTTAGPLFSDWTTQVDLVAEARYAHALDDSPVQAAQGLRRRLERLRRSGSWNLAALQALIVRDAVLSMGALYSASSLTWLWSSISREDSRGVPPIICEEEHTFQRYCRAVVKYQLRQEAIPVDSADADFEELRRLNLQLDTDDPSHYFSNVVHALAFAVKGHWKATQTLAEAAILACDQLDKTAKNNRQGREAAYLACVAARRSADNTSGLARARQFLDDAINRESRTGPEDIRFTSERLAIEERSLVLAHEAGRPMQMTKAADALEGLRGLAVSVRDEGRPEIYTWVLVQALVHYFELLLTLRDLLTRESRRGTRRALKSVLDRGGHPAPQLLADFRSVLGPNVAQGFELENDPLAYMVRDIATAIWGVDPGQREEARKSALTLVASWPQRTAGHETLRVEFFAAH